MGEFEYAIKNLAENEFFLILLVLCILAGLSFYFFFKFLRRYRIMQDMPTASLRSAAQGYNEFEGDAKLLPGEPIIAPLSKRSCVWYWYQVEEKQANSIRGKRITNWRVAETGISEGLFSLQGITGSAIINPDDAEVIPSKRDVWYGSTFYPQSGPKSFLGNHWLIGGRYRYCEKRIHEDDPLYVLGALNSLRRLTVSSLDEKVAALLRHWKKFPAEILSRFDTNKNGLIDENEWSDAVRVAKQQIQQELQDTELGVVDNLIEKPLDARQPYLLSALSQQDLIKRYQYRGWFSLSLFFILGVSAVWFFNVHFIG